MSRANQLVSRFPHGTGGHGFNAEQSKVADAALFAWFDKYLKAGK
jgi:hypothetical protein